MRGEDVCVAITYDIMFRRKLETECQRCDPELNMAKAITTVDKDLLEQARARVPQINTAVNNNNAWKGQPPPPGLFAPPQGEGGRGSTADRLQASADRAAGHISDTAQNFLPTQRSLAAASQPPPPPPSWQQRETNTTAVGYQSKKKIKSAQFFNKVKTLKQADPKGWNKGGGGKW